MNDRKKYIALRKSINNLLPAVIDPDSEEVAEEILNHLWREKISYLKRCAEDI